MHIPESITNQNPRDAVTNFPVPTHDKDNHKGMVGRLHPPGIFERWARINGFDLNFDPGLAGGLVRREGEIAGYVRPPLYRASKGSALTLQDVRPVTLQDKAPEELRYDQTDSG